MYFKLRLVKSRADTEFDYFVLNSWRDAQVYAGGIKFILDSSF